MFSGAVKAYQDGLYEVAEKSFEKFMDHYPVSDQGFIAGELRLLSKAQAELLRGQYELAAKDFFELVRTFPNSPRYIDSLIGEALARFELGEYPRVLEILSGERSDFRAFAAGSPQDPRVARGRILLAELRIDQNDHSAAANELAEVKAEWLDDDLKWRKSFLETRLEESAGNFEDAIASVSSLVELSKKLDSSDFLAQSIALHSSILESKGDIDQARARLADNLAKEVPAKHRRAALLNTVNLLMQQDKHLDALEFIDQNADDQARDLLKFTAGEIHLKQFYIRSDEAVASGRTNLLQSAQNYFTQVIQDHSDSELVGEAWMNLGWCQWEQATRTNRVEVFWLG